MSVARPRPRGGGERLNTQGRPQGTVGTPHKGRGPPQMEKKDHNQTQTPPVSIEPPQTNIDHRATKLCQKQTKHDKVALKIELSAKWLINLVESAGQGPSPANNDPPKPNRTEQGAFVHQNTKCLTTKRTKENKIKLLGRKGPNRGDKHPPHHKKTPKKISVRENLN
ncbi:hypothetical protein J6590_102235 [Homalodisca vitripennis]|nr:hypothetical protein J6590_102235 [Homalodisca vitripennis]